MDSIIDLLANKLVKETNNISHVVSPLSVVENSAGKRRLILDLRYLNKHIYTHKVKFDDWKCFQNFFNAGAKFMFKFDLKSGYHHKDINETFQTYLGFSWKIAGKVRHFAFTVLPFGLNSAPFLSTKIVRPLVKYWRRHLIKRACFLDDGLSVAESLSEAICNSQFVQETLKKSGFIVNCEKSVWYLYKSILAQTSWDSHFNVLYYHFAVEEITFWKQNIQTLNKRPLIPYKLPITKVYSDASNSGIGTCFEIKGKKYLIQKNFSSTEKCRSSTWRELEAIYYSLCSLPKSLNNNLLFWHTDNFAASKIVESGSSKPELQEKGVKIFDTCKVKNINLEITWIIREINMDADLISKLIDYDDWIVKNSTFKFLTKKVG